MKSILFLILMCLTSIIIAQDFEYVSEKFTKDHGLPDEYIKDLAIDSRGIIWILTRKGIVKFDGATFEPQNIVPSLPILNFEFDVHDNLWLKLRVPQNNFDKWDGLQIYDINASKILTLKEYCGFLDFDNSKFLNFWKDESGNILFSFDNKQVYYYDGSRIELVLNFESIHFINKSNQRENTISYTNYNRDTIFYKDLKTNTIESYGDEDVFFYIWKDGEIEFKSHYTSNWRELLKTRIARKYNLISVDNDTILSNHDGRCHRKLLDDDLYVSTNNRIYVYDLTTRKVINLSDIAPPLSTETEIILMKAHGAVLWVATPDGLIKIEKKKKLFQSLIDDNHLSTREILAISKDSILVCTEDGLHLIDNRSNEVLRVIGKGIQYYGISDLGDGKYLLGIVGTNCNIVDINNFSFSWFPHEDELSIPSDVRDIHINSFVDKHQRIWLTSRRGICRYDDVEKRLKYFHQEKLVNVLFTDIVQGNDDDHLFYLSDGGLFEVNIESNLLKTFDALKSKTISFISKDMNDDSVYWIGTRFEGLIKWKYDGDILEVIDVEEGLGHNNVHSVFEDNHNRLWLSTDYGISVYNKLTHEVAVITEDNGIQENEMNRHSYCFLRDSLIIYGGINGLVKFNPYDVRLENTNKSLDLKSMSYKNNLSNTVSVIPLEKNIDELILRRYQSEVKLIFDIPRNSFSNTLRYIFTSDAEWSYTQGNFIDLSTIKEGTSNLFVSKKIGINEWSSPKKILIIKRLPFYKSYWFYGLIFSILSLGTFLFINNRRVRALKLNKRIQQEVDIKTKELFYKNKSLTESKRLNEQLFGIIGHDLRSPLISLNNISKSINYLVEKEQFDNIKKLTNTVESNSKKSLAIIDRLIDWTQTQKESMLEFQEVNISELVDKCMYEQEEFANEKGIQITSDGKKWVKCVSNEASLLIVLGNVLSNAIKFSQINKTINIKFYRSESNVIIEVEDKGIGMDKSQLEKLSTYQSVVPKESTSGEIGLGMGIMMSSKILTKINGLLTYKSTVGVGTTATISLPI